MATTYKSIYTGAAIDQAVGQVPSLATKAEVNQGLQSVREVAEGKCKTYVLSYTTDAPTEEYFSEQEYYRASDGTKILTYSDFIDYTIGDSCMNSDLDSEDNSIFFSAAYLLSGTMGSHYVIRPIDLKQGDIILIIETSVPDRWFGESSLYKLETSKVDISHMVTDNTAQTILADKTFGNNSSATSNGIVFQGSNTSFTMRLSGYNMQMGGQYSTTETGNIIPFETSAENIGTQSRLWGQLFVNGMTVMNSFQETGGTVTLNTSQYNLFSGGAVQVKGTFLSLVNPLFLCPDGNYLNTYFGIVISGTGNYGNTYISKYSIDKNSKVLSITQRNNNYVNFTYDGGTDINGVQHLTPYANGNGDIGTTSEYFNNGYITNVYASNLNGSLSTVAAGGASSVGMKFWTGTQAQYNAIQTKDSSTVYMIVD